MQEISLKFSGFIVRLITHVDKVETVQNAYSSKFMSKLFLVNWHLSHHETFVALLARVWKPTVPKYRIVVVVQLKLRSSNRSYLLCDCGTEQE